jgi:hypothetical protein
MFPNSLWDRDLSILTRNTSVYLPTFGRYANRINNVLLAPNSYGTWYGNYDVLDDDLSGYDLSGFELHVTRVGDLIDKSTLSVCSDFSWRRIFELRLEFLNPYVDEVRYKRIRSRLSVFGLSGISATWLQHVTVTKTCQDCCSSGSSERFEYWEWGDETDRVIRNTYNGDPFLVPAVPQWSAVGFGHDLHSQADDSMQKCTYQRDIRSYIGIVLTTANPQVGVCWKGPDGRIVCMPDDFNADTPRNGVAQIFPNSPTKSWGFTVECDFAGCREAGEYGIE